MAVLGGRSTKLCGLGIAGLAGLGIALAVAPSPAPGEDVSAATRYVEDFMCGRLDTLELHERGRRHLEYLSDLNVFQFVTELSRGDFDRRDYTQNVAVSVSRIISGRTVTVLLPPKEIRDQNGNVRPFGSLLGIADPQRLGAAVLDLVEEDLAFVEDLYARNLTPGDIEIVTLPLRREDVFPHVPGRLASTYPFSRQIMFSTLDLDRVEGEGVFAIELSHLLHPPGNFGLEPFSWFSRAAKEPAALIALQGVNYHESPMLPYMVAVVYGPGAHKIDAVYEEQDRHPAGFISRETGRELRGYIMALREAMRHALGDYLERPHLWDTASWLTGMPDLCAFHFLGKQVEFDSTFIIGDDQVLLNVADVVRDELRRVIHERKHLDFEKHELDFFHHATQGATFMRLVDRLEAETSRDASPLKGRFQTEGRRLAAVQQGLGLISPDELVSDLEVFEILELKKNIIARQDSPKHGVETGLSSEQVKDVRDAVNETLERLNLEIRGLRTR
jgi:hypothetical protein